MSPLLRTPEPEIQVWPSYTDVALNILLVLLLISFLSNIGHYAKNLVSSGGKHIHSSGPRLEEVIIEDNDAASKNRV